MGKRHWHVVIRLTVFALLLMGAMTPQHARASNSIAVTAQGLSRIAASAPTVGPTPIFINEFHYDNAGTDSDEAIEIAGPAGTDLTGWSLVLYNGSNGTSYNTTALGGTIPDLQNGYGVLSFSYPVNGIQNGSPDGIALVDPTSAVIQFLSYEGSLTAVDGPASGLTSTDIGVFESSDTPVGYSLQLAGVGSTYESFTWSVPAPHTRGAINNGQSFQEIDPKINEFVFNHTGSDTNEYVEIFGVPNTDYANLTVVEIEGDGSGAGLIDDGTFAITTTNAAGLWVSDFLSNEFENGTVTLLLVEGYTGTVGLDLDTDNDGTLDVTAWTELIDSVAVSDGGSSDRTYSPVVLAAFYDGLPFGPGGASRIPDGWDTDTSSDWVRNDFDGEGLPGFSGTADLGEAYNTPGEPNRRFEAESGLSKSVTPASPLLGETVTYDVLLQNSGSLTDTVVFTDTLPTDADFAEWVTQPAGAVLSTTEITWTGDIGPGATVTFTFVMTNTATAGTPVTNTAEFSGTVRTGSAEAVYTSLLVTPINVIQGPGAASPEDGNVHTVEAVVTADFQEGDQLSGFFVQEEDADVDANPLTSEGLFIDATTPVAVGDLVRATGTADEFFGLTRLTSVTGVQVVASGQTLPTPADLTLPFSETTYLERFEGMAVRPTQPLYVTENYNLGRFGEVILSSGDRLDQPTQVALPGAPALAVQAANDLNQVILNDYSNIQNPDPVVYPSPYLSATNTLRGGDVITNMVAAVNYSFGDYKLEPVQLTIAPENPRPAAPPTVAGDVTVATVNVLNYFDTIDGLGTCTAGVGGVVVDCRGADSASEFDRQRTKIITAILELDADIIGLQEIENDGYADEASAIDDLVDGLNDVAGAGTYAYVDVDAGTGITNAAGLDAIKVGLIYQPARVALTGTTAVLDDTFAPTFYDDKNRVAVAQAFEDTVNGQVFTVVVNHLKSKGSDCDALGDPDTGDGQGNCNLTRTSAVTTTLDWLATDPTAVSDPDVLIIGDLNSYAMEDPIRALEEAGYTNLLKQFGSGDYSYVFFGQWGTLDYVMASPTMLPQVGGAAAWHINADEPNVLNYNEEFKSLAQVDYFYAGDEYRASDHDPIVVGIAFAPDTTITKTVVPETVSVGGTVTYTVVLANDGTAEDSVLMTDTLPADVVFGEWVDQPLGATQTVGQVAWSGTLAAGEAITVAFTAQSNAMLGPVVNTAAFVGLEQSGSADASHDVLIEPATSIAKLVTPGAARPGDVVMYTIELANTGNGDDTVTLTDTLPSEVAFAEWLSAPSGTVLSTDPAEITWTGTLTSGATLQWMFTVTNTASSGTVTNTAEFVGLAGAGSDEAVFQAATWRVWMPLVMKADAP